MTIPGPFLDELRARTPIQPLIARVVRLSRSGRNWKGCCPFHGEKTPSFHVYDDHFHCFGCGEHGDAITFVMKGQGLSFMDAVQALAADAGMSIPAPSPTAARAEQQRHDLYQVMDAAAAAFRRRLFLPEGAAALDYLGRRGITRDTIARFGLGWSGPGRGAIAGDLARENITRDQLVDAGLLRRDDDGAIADLFFNRVMFPIRDARGRIISFGGRVLGDGQPKYVNGPETTLFSKRRTLYGLDLARAAGRSGPPIVVEGYTDVIALHQANIPGAVAPLGTALTEDQLALLWRLSPAPVLCFDGDAAGQRAAARVLDMALPLIGVDRGLRFMTLPAGDDPDSLIRRDGADGMRAAIAAARPLSDAAFGLLRQPGGEPSAELRAALRARLIQAVDRVPDQNLKAELRRAWLARFLAMPVDDRAAPVDAAADRLDGGAEAVFRHCADTWPDATAQARGRLRAMAGPDVDLDALIVAAPVTEQDGLFTVMDARRPRARDWRILVAVRDGADNPDFSNAGLDETARRSVFSGRITDLVACDADLMTVTGCLYGVAPVLGWPRHPELTNAPARLCETPNAWLRDGCRGAVLIGDDVQVADWLLRCSRGLTVAAPLFGRAVEKKWRRAGRAKPEIYVREAA